MMLWDHTYTYEKSSDQEVTVVKQETMFENTPNLCSPSQRIARSLTNEIRQTSSVLASASIRTARDVAQRGG